MIANLLEKEKWHISEHQDQDLCAKLSYIILSKDRRALLQSKLDSLRLRQGAKEEQIFIGEDNQETVFRLVKNHLIVREVRPLERLETLMHSISTDYCVLTADDDTIISNDISRHIKFLDENPDYVGSQGLFYSKIEPTSPNESYRPSLQDKSPEQRIISLLENYGHFNYAIIRTSFLRKMCVMSKSLKSENSLNFQEVLWNIVLAASGKINVFHEPFVLRDPTQTKGWWRDFMAGNLADHLNEDTKTVSKAIMEITPCFNADTLVELIIYFIFKDSTCLSEETKKLMSASQERACGSGKLPNKMKALCTKDWA
jgi:glycosyltransferase domain-containing protein